MGTRDHPDEISGGGSLGTAAGPWQNQRSPDRDQPKVDLISWRALSWGLARDGGDAGVPASPGGLVVHSQCPLPGLAGLSRIPVNPTQELLTRRPSLASIGSLMAWIGPVLLADRLDSIQAYLVLGWFAAGAAMLTGAAGFVDLVRSAHTSRGTPFFLVSSLTAICVAVFLFFRLAISGMHPFTVALYSIYLLLSVLGGTISIRDALFGPK